MPEPINVGEIPVNGIVVVNPTGYRVEFPPNFGSQVRAAQLAARNENRRNWGMGDLFAVFFGVLGLLFLAFFVLAAIDYASKKGWAPLSSWSSWGWPDAKACDATQEQFVGNNKDGVPVYFLKPPLDC